MFLRSITKQKSWVRNAGSVKRLSELGIVLPNVIKPIANYQNAVRYGNLLYMSGVVPINTDGSFMKGKIGFDMDEKQGYNAARQAAITALAFMKRMERYSCWIPLDHVDSFDNIIRLIRVTGYVNCVSSFENTPYVLNGASDLFVSFFEEQGKHARSAIGVHTLPMGVPVEIDIIAEIRDCTLRQ